MYHYFLPILSGLFIGTSFIPFPPWAALFATVPLAFFVQTKARSFAEAIGAGVICQIVFTLILFRWIPLALQSYSKFSPSEAVFGFAFFCCVGHLFYPVACALIYWLRVHWRASPLLNIVLFSTLLALGEIFWPLIFPWNLGYGWYFQKSPLAQLAEIMGFEGLSWITHLTSALLTICILVLRKWRDWLFVTILYAFVGLCFLQTGTWLENRLAAANGSFKVLAVQPNLKSIENDYVNFGENYALRRRETVFQMTQQGLKQFPEASLVVLPENIFQPLTNQIQKSFHKDLQDFSKRIGKPVILGAQTTDQDELQHNSAALLSGDLEASPLIYNKYRLVPFFERAISPSASAFPPEPWIVLGHKVGVQICYEGLFSYASARQAQQGPEFIFNLTNDIWFGDTEEPVQHFVITAARSIEMRRPLVRVSNSGISALILANGQIVKQSPIKSAWTAQLEIPTTTLQQANSFYTRAPLLPRLLMLLTAVYCLLTAYRARLRP